VQAMGQKRCSILSVSSEMDQRIMVVCFVLATDVASTFITKMNGYQFGDDLCGLMRDLALI
jgi:hypothetical protein